MNYPWKKDWLPGVLTEHQLKVLMEDERLHDFNGKINPSSIDLTLSNECYLMHRGSIKPNGDSGYHHLLSDKLLAIKHQLENGVYKLEKEYCYVFKLNERLNFNQNGPIWGQATARSTIGRLDIIARLIVDGMDEYETYNPHNQTNGNMYLEVIPNSFPIIVKENTALSQLRLFYGNPEESEINLEIASNFLSDTNERKDGSLRVDLDPCPIIDNHDLYASAFCFHSPNPEYIDVNKDEYYDPCKSWMILNAEKINKVYRLPIQKDNFYIIRSKEKIALPKGVAVYCKPMDESIGEMRIHYAGFVHPFFGYERDNEQGTPLIFEVRGHNVNVFLENQEKLAKLNFYRMSEDISPREQKKLKKSQNEKYLTQKLKLSGVFKDWPMDIKLGEDFKVIKD